MNFPFEFVKKTESYDFVSPVINLIGNATVIAIGGLSLAKISYLALKALGFSKMVTLTATAIPLTIGAIGFAGVIVGCSVFTAICMAAFRSFGRS